MMPKSSEIEGLLSRLEAATGPDREIDRWLQLLLVQNGRRGRFKTNESWIKAAREQRWATDHFTRSIDAALDLVERVLPNYRWGVSTAGIKRGAHPDGKPAYMEGFRAHVTEHSALRPMPSVADAPTAPLAILLALFRALSARPRP